MPTDRSAGLLPEPHPRCSLCQAGAGGGAGQLQAQGRRPLAAARRLCCHTPAESAGDHAQLFWFLKAKQLRDRVQVRSSFNSGHDSDNFKVLILTHFMSGTGNDFSKKGRLLGQEGGTQDTHYK